MHSHPTRGSHGAEIGGGVFREHQRASAGSSFLEIPEDARLAEVSGWLGSKPHENSPIDKKEKAFARTGAAQDAADRAESETEGDAAEPTLGNRHNQVSSETTGLLLSHRRDLLIYQRDPGQESVVTGEGVGMERSTGSGFL